MAEEWFQRNKFESKAQSHVTGEFAQVNSAVGSLGRFGQKAMREKQNASVSSMDRETMMTMALIALNLIVVRFFMATNDDSIYR